MSTRAPTVLDRILAETRKQVEQRKRTRPLPSASPGARQGVPAEHAQPQSASDVGGEARPRAAARSFRDALAAPGISVIAEFKRRSPSAGALGEESRLDEVVDAYVRGGASAISVLTEEPNFGGSLDDLRAARARCELPLLRKDFIVDRYQLHEAIEAGADAVLLIAAALAPPELAELSMAAAELGLDVLVEVHDLQELDAALAARARIVGINNRDLRDFSVDLDRTRRLAAHIPAGVIGVSESGIRDAGQLADLEQRGIDAVLVGESLMRAQDPSRALESLRRFKDSGASF